MAPNPTSDWTELHVSCSSVFINDEGLTVIIGSLL